jgi:hypothetical protein
MVKNMKRKLKRLKVIKGVFRKKRESNIPRMPRGLHPESKKAWRQLLRRIDRSVLLPCDGLALALVADCLADRETIKRDFADKSDTKEYAELLELQNKMVYDGFAQFFLSPKSRHES